MLSLKTSRILIYFMVMALSHTSDLLCNFRRRSQSLYHPPYSPDLAPCDFFLFPKHIFFFSGCRCKSWQVLESVISHSLGGLSKASYLDNTEKTLKGCNYHFTLLDKWFFRFLQCTLHLKLNSFCIVHFKDTKELIITATKISCFHFKNGGYEQTSAGKRFIENCY